MFKPFHDHFPNPSHQVVLLFLRVVVLRFSRAYDSSGDLVNMQSVFFNKFLGHADATGPWSGKFLEQ